MAEKDLTAIDKTNLGEENNRNIALMSKYSRYKSKISFEIEEAKEKLKTVTKERYDYYKGYSDDEIHPVVMADAKMLGIYMAADDEIQKAERKICKLTEAYNFIDSVLKILTNRCYAVKNIQDWEIYLNGG